MIGDEFYKVSWWDHGQFFTKMDWLGSLLVSNTYRIMGNSLTSKNANSTRCRLLNRTNPRFWRDSCCDLTRRIVRKVSISSVLRRRCCSFTTLLLTWSFPFVWLSVYVFMMSVSSAVADTKKIMTDTTLTFDFIKIIMTDCVTRHF